MTASISLHVYTGTNAATESSAVGRIAFLSADTSAADTLTIAQNAITRGTNSYSKHLRSKIVSAPNNYVDNFKFWTDGITRTNMAIRFKVVGTGGATPGTGDSTPTTTSLTSSYLASDYISTNKFTWDTATYSTVGNVTKALVLQLQPEVDASIGTISDGYIYYSYDEA